MSRRHWIVTALLVWASVASARVAQAATLNEQMSEILRNEALSIASLGIVGGIVKAVFLLRVGKVTNGREAAMLALDVMLGAGGGLLAFFAARGLGVGDAWLGGCILLGGLLGSALLERVLGGWWAGLADRVQQQMRGPQP